MNLFHVEASLKSVLWKTIHVNVQTSDTQTSMRVLSFWSTSFLFRWSEYGIGPEYSGKQTWAKGVDPDQLIRRGSTRQGLQCSSLIQQFRWSTVVGKLRRHRAACANVSGGLGAFCRRILDSGDAIFRDSVYAPRSILLSNIPSGHMFIPSLINVDPTSWRSIDFVETLSRDCVPAGLDSRNGTLCIYQEKTQRTS